MFPRQFLCPHPTTHPPKPTAREKEADTDTAPAQLGAPGAHHCRKDPGHHRSESKEHLLEESRLCLRHSADRLEDDTSNRRHARPFPGPRQSGFTHEFPPRSASRWPRTAFGRQPPQGQCQGRNCFGLGFGSENKHSGFYRFTHVGCCFPFQQLVNQAFHSEASSL